MPSFSRWLKSPPRGLIGMVWCVCLLAGGVSTAHADLVKYGYTSASEGLHKDTIAGAGYINPSAGISFMVSGGIDRKLRISVTKSGSSSPVFTQTSSKVLGAGDVISFQGQNYYAEEFVSPKLADGSYKVTSDILSSTGAIVQTETLSVVIDSSSPTPGSFYPRPYSWGGPVLSGDVWKLGVAAIDAPTYSSFVLEGFTDTSGISKVLARVYRENGSLYKEQNVLFSEADKTASIQYRTGFFPDSDLDETFGLEFVVDDKAGNRSTTKRQKVMFDNIGNAPAEPFGVYDPSVKTTLAPGLTGFVPYAPGLAVKTNPIRLAWRIPKSNWASYRLGGLYFINSFGENKVAGEDANYVYLIASLPYGAEDGNYIRFYNFGEWGSQGTINYNLILADEAPKTPVIKSIDYFFSDKGWMSYSGRVVSPSELPVKVTRVRYTVEPRPFSQIATHMGTCTIPEGQTQCEIAVTRELGKGTSGYLHDQGILTNSDSSLKASGQWADVWWNDQYLPVLSYTYDSAEMVLTLKVRQPNQGDFQNRLAHNTAWLENSAGQSLSVTKKLTSSAGEYFEYEFDLKTLPEGTYSLVAAASENLGAVTRQKIFSFNSDRTSPSVKILKAGVDSIDTLDKLSFVATDNKDANPKITSVLLTGGPAKESISLSYRSLSNGSYALEYPILFPSMVEGERYTLTVSAQDSQKNIGTGSASFLYSPAMAGIVDNTEGLINIPAVPIQFDKKDGSMQINSRQLKLSDGSPVSGTYNLMATLRSDAVTAMRIGGKNVNPGQTVNLGQLNFTNTGGKISLPVLPLTRGAVGSNGVIISTSAPNSPVVYANINTWMPKVTLSVSNQEPVQSMTGVQIELNTSSGNICRLTTDASFARNADPVLSPVCLVEWTSMPRGITEQPIPDSTYPMSFLAGRALDVGKQSVAYSISIFSVRGEKITLSSGEQTISVKSASASATFAQSMEGEAITRAIEKASLTMSQTSGTTCSITGDEQKARAAGASGGDLVCLIQFTQLPSDLKRVSQDPIRLEGTFSRAGNFQLTWVASLFDTTGAQLTLESGQSTIRVVHPKVNTSLRFSVNESSSSTVLSEEDVPEAWESKSYLVVSNPKNGVVSASADGFSYSPDKSYVGADSFAYRVVDGSGMTVDGLAEVEVVRYNYPPTKAVVTLATREGLASAPAMPVVTDSNLWDTHHFEVTQSPKNGIVDWVEGGFVYTPHAGFYGNDSFKFLAIDEGGYGVEGQGAASVFSFNMAPTAISPAKVTFHTGAKASVRLQVSDPNLGDTHKLEAALQPEHGLVTFDDHGLLYDTDKDGEFVVIVRAIDSGGLSYEQPIVINVVPHPKGNNRIRIGAPISKAHAPGE